MFFRYGEQMRWTKPGIADAIRGPRVYQHEQLPMGPSWADVQRLLASTETNRKADIRDRPIPPFARGVYGLRVGEVQRLRLEDIDWVQKTISITATKQLSDCPRLSPHSLPCRCDSTVHPRSPPSDRISRDFPTIACTAAALPTWRPLGNRSYTIPAPRYQLKTQRPTFPPSRVRYTSALPGSHAYGSWRSHLGHRSLDSTRIYAKVDMPALREVANLDLGGLL